MSLLSRDAILAAADRPLKTVPVPEWGGDVLIQTMDGRTRAQYEDATDGPYELLRATLIAMCVVDADGRPLFTAADVQALNDKSGAVLDRIFRAITRHNRLRKIDREADEKNFEPASGGNSCTDSPATSSVPSPSCSSGPAPTN